MGSKDSKSDNDSTKDVNDANDSDSEVDLIIAQFSKQHEAFEDQLKSINSWLPDANLSTKSIAINAALEEREKLETSLECREQWLRDSGPEMLDQVTSSSSAFAASASILAYGVAQKMNVNEIENLNEKIKECDEKINEIKNKAD